MATLVIREPDGSSRDVEFGDELTIGRSEGSGLQLSEGGVSRRHATLTVEADGRVWVEDLGSAHGTFLDGAPLEERSLLEPGSSLQIGDYTLELRRPRARPARPPSGSERPVRRPRPAAGADASASEGGEGARPGGRPRSPAGGGSALARRPSSDDAVPRGPHLKGLTGPWLNRTWVVRGSLMVGRQEGVGLLIDDASVSRQHAEITVGSEGAEVRDLGSANGSALNGQPLGPDPEPLMDGDALLFGNIEFTYSDGASSRSLPVRSRPGRAVPSRRGASGVQRAGGDDDGGGMPPDRKRLMIVGGSVFGALLLLVIVLGLVNDTAAPPPAVSQSAGPRAQSPEQRLKELISRCRTHASLELGTPDWARAGEACNAALDIDPINEEAITLTKKITLEKDASDLFIRAERALSRNNGEEALSLFQAIPKESGYFGRARTQVVDALERVKRKHLEDCKVYIRNDKWKAAADSCEKHMNLACSSIPRDQFVPPVGYTLSLRPRRGRNEWKPTNADFIRFWNAREKAGLGNEPWNCPATDLFRVEEETNTPKLEVTAIINKRYSDKVVQRALLEYWEGKAGESAALFQRARNQVEKAAIHNEIDQLKRQVENIFQLYQNGQASLQAEDPERAAESFKEALAMDQELMQDPTYKNLPSFYRTSMQKDLADQAYHRGRFWADRRDIRKGCTVWKLGFSFFSGNIDLNKAVRFCSEQALAALNSANGCDALEHAQTLAVDGDGVIERVRAKKAEFGCL